jgi:alkaline phosphatase D
MRRWILFPVAVLTFSLGKGSRCPAQEVMAMEDVKGLPKRIAFGSCAHQDKEQPILREVVAAGPEVFVYLGDNIYGDTEDMAVLRAKYEKLAGKAEFQDLRSKVAVTAIWDDHDYGANDAGREYRMKEESRQIFLDFWKVPKASPRRGRPGIYGSHRYREGDRVLQLILLDTRFFRDPLKRKTGPPWKNDYEPDPDPGKSLLGEEQWKWLEEQLGQPADVRIIATSIQFSHEYNGWESWTNLPAQRRKMTDVIRKTRANGVIFISGDVHWGEISRLPVENGYPLYDVTSSGLTEDWETVEPNANRVGPVIRANNFGMIEIDWSKEDPELALGVYAIGGKEKNRHVVRLSELRHP